MTENPNQTNAEKADALVDMIEQLMENGSGHLVVTEQDTQEGLRVDTYRSMDCAIGNQACCQPTELMDEDE
ncbi:MAG: hypothetical protein ACI4TG_04060 [Ruminococcus sp.]